MEGLTFWEWNNKHMGFSIPCPPNPHEFIKKLGFVFSPSDNWYKKDDTIAIILEEKIKIFTRRDPNRLLPFLLLAN